MNERNLTREELIKLAENDPFAPPKAVTQCHCIHCDENYMTCDMEFRYVPRIRSYLWCCKDPSCDGRGYGMDIFPGWW